MSTAQCIYDWHVCREIIPTSSNSSATRAKLGTAMALRLQSQCWRTVGLEFVQARSLVFERAALCSSAHGRIRGLCAPPSARSANSSTRHVASSCLLGAVCCACYFEELECITHHLRGLFTAQSSVIEKAQIAVYPAAPRCNSSASRTRPTT